MIHGQEEEKQNSSANQKPVGERPFFPCTKGEDVKEIMEMWDANGFGYSNLYAKQQLLAWLDDSKFLHPGQVIVKAMKIACANNKRKLNYVVAILQNWQNESLLTMEEIESYQEKLKSLQKTRQKTETVCSGRAIPNRTEVDLTAGEDW
ncbi:DnaD domain-containing protein [Pseudoneobacillus sp. C159]